MAKTQEVTLKCGCCGKEYTFFTLGGFTGIMKRDCDDCINAEKSRENLE